MHGEYGHGVTEAVVGKGKGFGTGMFAGMSVRRALCDHLRRGFDRHKLEIVRFVGAGAGSDVDDSGGTFERSVELSGEFRIGCPVYCVTDTDVVVEGSHGFISLVVCCEELRSIGLIPVV